MIAVEDTVLVLLAAGLSERFGDVGSKLDQEFLNRPLGIHSAVALEALPFRRRIAITAGAALDYSPFGFTAIANDDPASGLASSVKLGVAQAIDMDAAGVLVTLADMPRITAAHILRLFDASTDARTVVASSDGCEPKPPALFGTALFETLLTLDGDSGARDLVRGGRHVVTTPAELIDVDTPEELEALRRLVHEPPVRVR